MPKCEMPPRDLPQCPCEWQPPTGCFQLLAVQKPPHPPMREDLVDPFLSHEAERALLREPPEGPSVPT